MNNSSYVWACIITVLGILTLLPLTIWGGIGGLIIGVIGIALFWGGHLNDKEKYAAYKQEKQEKAKRNSELDEQMKILSEVRARQDKEIAEINERTANSLREYYELRYGKEAMDKYNVLNTVNTTKE